jgi:hypothetical protein
MSTMRTCFPNLAAWRLHGALTIMHAHVHIMAPWLLHIPSDFGLEELVCQPRHASERIGKDTVDIQLWGVWAAQAESAHERRASGIGHLRAPRAVCSTNTPVSHGDCRYGSRRWCDAPSRYPARGGHTLEAGTP